MKTKRKQINRLPIKFFATNVGKTLQDISDKTGIDVATLSKLNTGRLTFLKLEYIQPLCDVLELTPNELLLQFYHRRRSNKAQKVLSVLKNHNRKGSL